MSEAPRPPSSKPNIEIWLELTLFRSRWLMAPFYVGLVFALGGLLVVFGGRVLVLVSHLGRLPELVRGPLARAAGANRLVLTMQALLAPFSVKNGGLGSDGPEVSSPTRILAHEELERLIRRPRASRRSARLTERFALVRLPVPAGSWRARWSTAPRRPKNFTRRGRIAPQKSPPPQIACGGGLRNTPERIRTSSLRFRRTMLYPIELRVRGSGSSSFLVCRAR